MSKQTAYIKLAASSAVASVSLDDVKAGLDRYKEQTALTGKQLDWGYAEAAFPYRIETDPGGSSQWFYLKGVNNLYKYIVFGIDRPVDESEQSANEIQVVLPEGATHGDKSKANELCKYLAKHFKAELHMFNGRIMFFNPRK